MNNERSPKKPTSAPVPHEHDSGFPMELAQQFLVNQAQELANQAQEIELKKQNESNGFQYACKALDAQKEDRRDRRSQITTFMKWGFWFLIFALLLIGGFIAICIYTNNIAVMVSIFKAIAYIAPSAGGGYFFGLYRGRKANSGSQSSYADAATEG